MGEEDTQLAANSDSEFDEDYQDEYAPDAGELAQAPSGSAGREDAGNIDDDDEPIDDANLRWLEEEERAPTSEDIWRKAQQDFVEDIGASAGDVAAAGASSSSSSGANRPWFKAGQPQATASAEAADIPPVSVSRSYTSLINNTKKQTFMLPEEFVLIVDESDVDWYKNLVNTATMRLVEVEKELRVLEQEWSTNTVKLEQPLFEVFCQALVNLNKHNISAEPSGETNRWWAERTACYYAAVLNSSAKYATEDGEALGKQECPIQCDFVKNLDPVALNYINQFRDLGYALNINNKEKKRLPRFVNCLFSQVRIPAKLRMFQLGTFAIRLQNIITAPSVTRADQNAILQYARLDIASSLLSRAFKIIAPKRLLDKQSLFNLAVSKDWPFRGKKETHVHKWAVAVYGKLAGQDPWGKTTPTPAVTSSSSASLGKGVQPPPPPTGPQQQTISKQKGKGGNPIYPQPSQSQKASMPQASLSPLNSLDEQLAALSDPASAPKASSSVPKAAAGYNIAKNAVTIVELLGCNAREAQANQPGDMISPRSGRLGSQLSEGEEAQILPPQQPIFASGTGTHNNPIVLSPQLEGQQDGSSSSLPAAGSSSPIGGIFPLPEEAAQNILPSVPPPGGGQPLQAAAVGIEPLPQHQQSMSTEQEFQAFLQEEGLEHMEDAGEQAPGGGSAASATSHSTIFGNIEQLLSGNIEQTQWSAAGTGNAASALGVNGGSIDPFAPMQTAALGQTSSNSTSATAAAQVVEPQLAAGSQNLAGGPAGPDASADIGGAGGPDPVLPAVASTQPPSGNGNGPDEPTGPSGAGTAEDASTAGAVDASAQLAGNVAAGQANTTGPTPTPNPGTGSGPASSGVASAGGGQILIAAPVIPDPNIQAQQLLLAQMQEELRKAREQAEKERQRSEQMQQKMQADQAAERAATEQRLQQMQKEQREQFHKMLRDQKAANDVQAAAAAERAKTMQAASDAQAAATAEKTKTMQEEFQQKQAAAQKLQEQREQLFRTKIERDQKAAADQKQQFEKLHEETLQNQEKERQKHQADVQKAKEALVNQQQQNAIRKQLGGHNPGLAASNPLAAQHLPGAMQNSGLDHMFAMGPSGLDVVEADPQSAAVAQTLDQMLNEGKAKLDSLREHLKLQADEKDLLKTYHEQEEDLARIKQQIAEQAPDSGKYLGERNICASALFAQPREPAEEEPVEDPMFRMRTANRPEGIGIAKKDRKLNTDSAFLHMELPKSGVHLGGYRTTEAVPRELQKHVMTVGLNPNSDKRWINPKVGRQILHEISLYLEEMSSQKLHTGTCIVYDFGGDRMYAVSLRSTVDAALREFDKDKDDPEATHFVDFREDLMILVANGKTEMSAFKSAVDTAAEKDKVQALDMTQIYLPIGFTTKDRLSRTWETIVLGAVANDGGLFRVFQVKDQKELASLRALLARLREDVERVVGTEDPDPARINKTNAEKLWKEFNLRSCVLGITYVCGRIGLQTQLTTKMFYDAIDGKMKENESALIKQFLALDRTIFLLTLAFEYISSNPHGRNAPPISSNDLARRWCTWTLTVPKAPKEQESYQLQQQAKTAKEKAAAAKQREENKKLVSGRNRGGNSGKNPNGQHRNDNNQNNGGGPGKGNQQQVRQQPNKRPGDRDGGGEPEKRQRAADGAIVDKQKAFVEAMRIQYCKKYDIEYDQMKEDTKADCCIFHICYLGGIKNNKGNEVKCNCDPASECKKDPNHTNTETWFAKNKKLRKKGGK
eukprot:g12528.t1